MDISVLYICLLSASLLASVKANPQAEDSSERISGRSFELDLIDFPFDVQDRQPIKKDEKESRTLNLLGLGDLGRYPGNQFGGLSGSFGGFPEFQSYNGFTGQNINQRIDANYRQPNTNGEIERRRLNLLRLEALASYPGNQLSGFPGSQGGFPASQSSNRITGQNVNQRVDRGLFDAFPGSLNGLLAPQGLIGTTPGLSGTNPNLIEGQSGLLGLTGLVTGTSGLGDISPLASLGALPGSSPIGDIMAMASFLTKDELKDMFSKDKNFNFIPVILQDSKEEKEVQQFISFLNKRSEQEKESLEASNNEFEKRGQRSLNTIPNLTQQIRGNALQRLTQQNLLQSGINPFLLSEILRESETPNPFSSQQNSLQGLGINPLLTLQSQQNSLQRSDINPLLAFQSQLQSSSNNRFSESLLSQGQSNQAATNGLGLNPLVQQALLSQGQSNQAATNGLGLNPLVQQALLSQGQSNQAATNGFGLNPLVQQALLSQGQSNQAANNGLGLNPLVQQALLRQARLQQSLQSQQPQFQALQQLLLLQARDLDSDLLRQQERQRDISAHLPVSDLRERERQQAISSFLPAEHKHEPFRFPRD